MVSTPIPPAKKCLLFALAFAAHSAIAEAGAPDASEQIDRLLEKQYAAVGIEPNPPIDDERFLRRIYLDIGGRIPSLDEARAFLDDADPAKRSRLIDELLASEGAVSHSFNYWADILRLSEELGNNRLQTYAYSFWLKDALRKNLPYDEMVRQLITARGWIWENGATAYYHRDRGMPLDNMSNTVRVFLGTRLECAQCHNHPFDRWTQMDYFEMAALSHTMDARLYAPAGRTAVAEFQTEFMEAAREKAPNGVLEPGTPDYLRYRAIGQVNADLFAFMKFVRCRETPETLTLPHDYQYSDARPEDPVTPATMFGEPIDVASVGNLVDAYADWMTSPKNPRFSAVIANRLWKRVMGRGLVEPVDEMMDHTEASNPELFDFLTRRIVELDFDLRAFQSEIFKTRAYQREVTNWDVGLGEADHFPGPALRRLTAEQLWDSLVTLAIPNPDYYMPQMNLRLSQLDRLRQIHVDLESRTPEEIVALAKEFADHYVVNYQRVEELTALHKAALAAKDEEKTAEIAKELNAIRNQEKGYLHRMAHGDRVNGGRAEAVYAAFGIGGEHLPLEKIVKSLPKSVASPEMGDLVRASELPVPAPRGHFLREFGQSDREVIENASDSASVPQALALMNGPVVEVIASPRSQLRLRFDAAATPAEKIDTLFLSLLSRRPTPKESVSFQSELARSGEGGDALADLLWVLVNSQQFRFQY